MGYFKRFQIEQEEKASRWWETAIPRKRTPIFREEPKPTPVEPRHE